MTWKEEEKDYQGLKEQNKQTMTYLKGQIIKPK